MASNGKRGAGASPPSSLLDNTGISRHTHGLFTRFKVIGYGKYLEVYEFQAPINVYRHRPSSRKLLEPEEVMEILVNPEKQVSNNRSEEYRKQNAIRAKNRIRRLVQRNFDKVGKLLTLTFRDTDRFDITSLKACHQRYAYFVKRLSSQFPNTRYLAVPEFQKRGAVHYHLVLDIPYTPVEELRELWPYGFIQIKKIFNPACVGLYIAKYVSKAMLDERYQNHRCFHSSKNLKQPVIAYGDQLADKIKAIEAKGFKPTYTKTYHSDWYGEIKYSQYNLYQTPAPKE